MQFWRHLFWLGSKEIRAFLRDPMLLLFVFYAFTVYVATAGGGLSLEVKNASVAVVDEDRSPLSTSIANAIRPPTFRRPERIERRAVDDALARGTFSFVLYVPRSFQTDVIAARTPVIDLDVDATAISQAYLGALFLRRIVAEEVQRYVGAEVVPRRSAEGLQARVRFNPNREGRWHVSVTELLFVITLLSVVLPAAALLREREHGTIEHLLVMPLRPAEIVLAKMWTSSLVVLLGTGLSVALIIRWWFGVPIRGSIGLFLVATLLYQLATAGLGVFLATLVRTVPQVALLSILVVAPMIFLSGVWTPEESMPLGLRWIMLLSPLKYYGQACFGIFFRGAGLPELWRSLTAVALIGAALTGIAIVRFRSRFAVVESR